MTSTEFFRTAKNELNLDPRRALELLGVRTVDGLDLRDALGRLRDLAAATPDDEFAEPDVEFTVDGTPESDPDAPIPHDLRTLNVPGARH